VTVRRVLDTSGLGECLAFDVDSGGGIVVLTAENVYDARKGTFLFGEPLRGGAWLSLAGGTLRLLAEGALYAVEGGGPRKLVEVPLKSPVVASDGERIFVAGVTDQGRSVLFLYKEGAGHKPLLELDAPVDAMAVARGALFFSAGRKIFVLREGRDAALFAELPGFPFVASLAVDEENGIVYFSDGE